jgi:hypothetical protein
MREVAAIFEGMDITAEQQRSLETLSLTSETLGEDQIGSDGELFVRDQAGRELVIYPDGTVEGDAPTGQNSVSGAVSGTVIQLGDFSGSIRL